MIKFLNVFLFIVLVLHAYVHGQQNIGIGTNIPELSSILEIKSTNKGLLIPRINLASDNDVTTISNPSIWLLVFNTNSSLPDGDGLYYWNGLKWNKFITMPEQAILSWATNGNSSTNDNHFIGTLNDKPLRFRVDNFRAGLLNKTNTWLGYAAGNHEEAISHIVAIGNYALFNNSSGNGRNTAIGAYSGNRTVSGSDNFFAGFQSGYNNISGNGNVAIGSNALYSNLSQGYTVAIGDSALFKLSSGANNTAVGSSALSQTEFGSSNTAVGFQSLKNNINGNRNTGIGEKSLFSNTSGLNNTAIGELAAANNVNGNGNTVLGHEALLQNISGSRNIAIGTKALRSSTSADESIAIGDSAMAKYTGNLGSQIAIGSRALLNFVSGNSTNLAIGMYSMMNTTTGASNTAIGTMSLFDNTTGFNHTAVGMYALESNTTGLGNTAFGGRSITSNTTGTGNSALGYGSLFFNTTGSYNTALGASCGPPMGYTNLINTTTIGYSAEVITDNTMAFGNTDVTRFAFGLSTTTGSHVIEVGSNGGDGNGAFLTQGGTWTNTSDMNKKEDFSDLDITLLMQKISELKIQKWRYKETNEYHIGPVAQQFYQLFQLGEDEKGISTIDPAGIALAAIQQLMKDNELLKKRIEVLEKLILRRN